VTLDEAFAKVVEVLPADISKVYLAEIREILYELAKSKYDKGFKDASPHMRQF
jgi:hypothetical protein